MKHSSQAVVSKACLPIAILFTCGGSLHAQTNLQYQKPPRAIVDLVDTRPTPFVEVSPEDSSGTRWMFIGYISGFPTIADLAQPELRLAGLRINPKTNGPSRGRYYTALGMQALPGAKEIKVSGMPDNAKIRYADWAPDARHFSFVNISDAAGDTGLSLWIVDVSNGQAQKIPGIALNGIFGSPCEWAGDSQSLLCKTIVGGRSAAPKRSDVPAGPVVQENLGRITPGPTYQDLLKSPEDEQFFDYYATSQVRLVNLDGKSSLVGKPVDSFTAPNLLDVPKSLGFVFHYGAMQGLWIFLHRSSTWILVRHESELLPNLSIQMRLEPIKLSEAIAGKT